MRIRALSVFLLLATLIAGAGLWRAMRVHETATASSRTFLASWSPEAAASYLDYREGWWQSWPPAQRDHGTICVSCHTTVPYALARPRLQQALGHAGMPGVEKTMLDNVEKRVGQWQQMTPFYSDAADGPGKTTESHATEAVLNAVILASEDDGQEHLRPITRTALDEVWALQEKSGERAGGWKWQDFGLAPWESAESGYQGAAMLAIALGDAPDHYAVEPGASNHVELLQDYLRREYRLQPLMSQVYVLWASARMPGLLNEAERTKLLTGIRNYQQEDGGWALSSLDKPKIWKRLEIPSVSDGCATGLVVLALEESGMTRNDKTLGRGLEWLEQHQQKDGSWLASSLNERRDPNSEVGHFMSDAATAYAALALEIAQTDGSGAAAAKR
jgi:squalene-hopene/tetraprenyl-beta-curcumene cyclase